MKFSRSAAILSVQVALLQHAAVADSQREAVTPIQKVIELLNGMLSKAKQEKADEQATFREFKHWCELTRADKARLIGKAADDIVQLQADIKKAEADADKLGVEMKAIDSSVDSWEAEVGTVKKVRADEHAEYKTEHQDYSESIEAIERAIVVLKERSASVPQSPASLLELRRVSELPRVPSEARRALASLLQLSGSSSQPEANAYEFQSSGVVGMLKKLEEKFEAELQALVKDETNRKANSDVMLQRLNDDIGYAQKSRADKAELRGERREAAAGAKGDLSETQTGKAADEAYRQEATSECAQKSEDYESRQTTRAEEIQAVQKAIEIIASPSVSGAGDKHLPSALLEMPTRQQRRASSLVQMRGSSEQAPAQAKVAAILLQRAGEAKSQFLVEVASRVGADPFAKVKKMLKDLVAKLIEEANSEADHKGWCDTEMATNSQTREIKSAEADNLSAKNDELTSLAAKLGQEISDLSEAVVETQNDVSERTEERKQEKAENAVTIADAKAASVAVSKAIKVLKEFYAKASEGASFEQSDAPSLLQVGARQPEMAEGAYTGMQGASGGVLGMLEVIASDFARLEVETSSAEDEAQREFEAFSASAADDVALKETEARHKGFQRNRAERDLNQARKELEGTQTELAAAMEHYDKLKPACIAKAPTFEERVTRRKQEIASLREALEALSEDVAGF